MGFRRSKGWQVEDATVTRRAVARAYLSWAKRYPGWAAAFFDEHFLAQQLYALGAGDELPLATTLAEAWSKQFHLSQARAATLVSELTPVAADFLCLVATARVELGAMAEAQSGKWRWFFAWWPRKARRLGSFS